MKKLAYYFSAAILGATVMFSSCKKKTEDDPAPVTPPVYTGTIYTSTMTSTNMGNTGTANVTATISSTDKNPKIRLDVSGSNNMDYIYVMVSYDNGAFQPLSFSTIKNASNQTFTGNSSDYSLQIPNLSSFIVDLPIYTSPINVTGVYQIWITNGAGSFMKPAKNRDLGIATVTLKKSSGASNSTFATASVDLGSQSSDDYGSLLVTSGQVSALNTADYVDSPSSADIRFVTLTGGKKDNNSTELFLYSPADIANANPPVAGQSAFDTAPLAESNTTYFALYTGTDFETITAEGLAGLNVGTANNVQVSADNVYMFETAAGKKGLIKINLSWSTINVVGTGSTTAKNINAQVKVLN